MKFKKIAMVFFTGCLLSQTVNAACESLEGFDANLKNVLTAVENKTTDSSPEFKLFATAVAKKLKSVIESDKILLPFVSDDADLKAMFLNDETATKLQKTAVVTKLSTKNMSNLFCTVSGHNDDGTFKYEMTNFDSAVDMIVDGLIPSTTNMDNDQENLAGEG